MHQKNTFPLLWRGFVAALGVIGTVSRKSAIAFSLQFDGPEKRAVSEVAEIFNQQNWSKLIQESVGRVVS